MKNVITIVGLLAAAGTANAQAFSVAYDTFSLPGDQPSVAGVSDNADVFAGSITRGAGLNPNVGGNSINSSGWALGDGDDADDFFSLTFDVAAGKSVNLDQLIIGTDASNTGPRDLGLFVNADGFTNPVALWSTTPSFSNDILDLSSVTGLTGSVEFRIFAVNDIQADGDGSISNGGTLRIVDFFDNGDFIDTQFSGTVVPTPGAAALMGLAGVAGLRRRRA